MFGSEIRDKDGVSATVSPNASMTCTAHGEVKLMFAEMTTELRSQGWTVQSYLQGLYEKCAFHFISPLRKLTTTSQIRLFRGASLTTLSALH